MREWKILGDVLRVMIQRAEDRLGRDETFKRPPESRAKQMRVARVQNMK